MTDMQDRQTNRQNYARILKIESLGYVSVYGKLYCILPHPVSVDLRVNRISAILVSYLRSI